MQQQYHRRFTTAYLCENSRFGFFYSFLYHSLLKRNIQSLDSLSFDDCWKMLYSNIANIVCECKKLVLSFFVSLVVCARDNYKIGRCDAYAVVFEGYTLWYVVYLHHRNDFSVYKYCVYTIEPMDGVPETLMLVFVCVCVCVYVFNTRILHV